MNKRTGQLEGTDVEHPASGTVVLSGDTLMLQDANITEAPDAQVYLAPDFDQSKGVKLADLASFTGNSEYAIPEGVDPAGYNSVVIWCDEFSVPIGKARLGT